MPRFREVATEIEVPKLNQDLELCSKISVEIAGIPEQLANRTIKVKLTGNDEEKILAKVDQTFDLSKQEMTAALQLPPECQLHLTKVVVKVMKEGGFTALFGKKYDYKQSFNCDMFEHRNIFSQGIAFNPPFEVILKIK